MKFLNRGFASMRRSRIRKLPSTELPQGSDERSTELRDMFGLSFCNLFILVNKLILLIYMSSQTVDLSHSFEME